MYYELAYLINPQLAEKDQQAAVTQVRDLITELGGNVINELPAESRPLGYLLKKNRRGLLAVQVFALTETRKLPGLQAKLALNDKIMRVMVTRHAAAPDYAAIKAALAAAALAGRGPKAGAAAAPLSMGVPAPKEALKAAPRRKTLRSRPAAPSAKKQKTVKGIDESLKEIISDKIKV